ncbi:hypothetical protein EWM62_09700 [Mucilaginibacter terrigena]|uniref:Uncharacterized protein n=1 Tax=Mucilaginibacter terrigena TaxID=2492395 RepID=A0A4Q5LND2_9SPHI|nr:hypothetical protein [Mucilaginibacter terrigena]RYU90902.1 hypothetical protein EWM62_09700 [Mucilaginibacter terrigena]
MNPAWSNDQRYIFLQTYLRILKKETNKEKQFFILNEIAQFQAFYQVSLAKTDFNNFIFYIQKCKVLSENDLYESDRSIELNKRLVNCIAIVCPQIFVANYLNNLEKARPMVNGILDSTNIKKININYLYPFEFLSDKTKERIDTIFNTIDFNEKLQGKKLYDEIKNHKRVINYWLRVYNGMPFNTEEVKRKVLNNEM